MIYCCVADPHHYNANPDPSFYVSADRHHCDADPDASFLCYADSHHFMRIAYLDPSCHLNADPDPFFHQMPNSFVYRVTDPTGHHFEPLKVLIWIGSLQLYC